MNARELKENFIDNFHQFIERLVKKYPDNTIIKRFKTQISVVNDTLLINVFNEIISKYRRQIFDRDDEFFLEQSFSEYSVDGIDFEKMVRGIKDLWIHPDTNEKTKDSIWQYLKLLLILSDKYVENINSPRN